MPIDERHEPTFRAFTAEYQRRREQGTEAQLVQGLEGMVSPEQYEYLKGRVWEYMADLEAGTQELMALNAQQAQIIEEYGQPPLLRGMVLSEPREGLALIGMGTRRFEVGVGEAFEGVITPGREVVLDSQGAAIIDVRDPWGGGEVGQVERQLPDGRLVVGDHGMSLVLDPVPVLRGLEFEVGDSIRYLGVYGLAFEKLPPSDSEMAAFNFEAIDRGALQTIAGLQNQMDELMSLITLRRRSELTAGYGLAEVKGCVLHGPPGCGKTLLVKAVLAKIADDAAINAQLLVVPPSGLSSMWVGEGPRKTRELFASVRREARNGTLIAIVFDELEWLSARRGRSGYDGGAQANDKLVQAVCHEIDGMNELKNVFIIGTTNRFDALDTALTRPGRLELPISIPRPKAEGARSIFLSHLRDKPVRLNGKPARTPAAAEELVAGVIPDLFNPEALFAQVVSALHRDGRQVTHSTPDFVSGAHIAAWVQQAARRACLRDIEEGQAKPTGITPDDLREAISLSLDRLADTITPSNLPDHLGLYDDPDARMDIVSVTSARPQVPIHRYITP